MRRLETMPTRDSYPYFPEQMETQPAPSRSGPRVVGPQPYPNRRPSNWDSLVPIGLPRRLARERSTPPESAPPANPDTAQSARPIAATDRESVGCMAAPERPAPGEGRLERPPASEARSRSTELTTRGKPDSDCPNE